MAERDRNPQQQQKGGERRSEPGAVTGRQDNPQTRRGER